jgi:hypothetical protein
VKLQWLSILVAALLGVSSTSDAQRQGPPIIVDYFRPPDSLEDAIKKADLVAVVRTLSAEPAKGRSSPMTYFVARITEVLSSHAEVSVGSTIRIARLGGLVTIKGVEYLQEEHRFPPWSVGQTLVLFLEWESTGAVFVPAFGPDFAFTEDGDGLVRSSGHRSRVAASFTGRPLGALVASIRSKVRS